MLIVADPTKRREDREEDGESRFVRSSRLLAYLLSKNEANYAVRIEHLHHALRALDILEALEAHLDAWHRTTKLQTPEGWEPRFLCVLCGHGRDGGIETHPDDREHCSHGAACTGNHYVAPYHASQHAMESLMKSTPGDAKKDGSRRDGIVFCGDHRTLLPYEAIFRLLNCYPGKKAVIIETCRSGSFVPALLKIQPRNLVVVSASGSTELAYGQRLVEFLTTQIRDEASTDLRRIIDLLPPAIAAQRPVVWIATPDGHLLASKDFPLLKDAQPGPRPVHAAHEIRTTMALVPLQEEPPPGSAGST